MVLHRTKLFHQLGVIQPQARPVAKQHVWLVRHNPIVGNHDHRFCPWWLSTSFSWACHLIVRLSRSNPAGLLTTQFLARDELNTPLLCVFRSQRTSPGQPAQRVQPCTNARRHACDDGEPRVSDPLTSHAWSHVVPTQTAFKIKKRMPTSTPSSWLNVQGRGGDTLCVFAVLAWRGGRDPRSGHCIRARVSQSRSRRSMQFSSCITWSKLDDVLVKSEFLSDPGQWRSLKVFIQRTSKLDGFRGVHFLTSLTFYNTLYQQECISRNAWESELWPSCNLKRAVRVDLCTCCSSDIDSVVGWLWDASAVQISVSGEWPQKFESRHSRHSSGRCTAKYQRWRLLFSCPRDLQFSRERPHLRVRCSACSTLRRAQDNVWDAKKCFPFQWQIAFLHHDSDNNFSGEDKGARFECESFWVIVMHPSNQSTCDSGCAGYGSFACKEFVQ